jgi:hypothetical protein
LRECQAVLTDQDCGHAENPELQTLVYRLASLACLPVIPVFVDDGPQARKKRGNETHLGQLMPLFRELVDTFGFYYHMVNLIWLHLFNY